MSPRTRVVVAFVLLLGTLGTAASYGFAYDSRLGQHAVSVGFDPVSGDVPDAADVTPVENLPSEAADVVRTGVEDGYVTVYRDDSDDLTDALESLSGYVRVEGEVYQVLQVADENMTLFGPLLTLTAMFLSMGLLGFGVAALRTGGFRPLSVTASLSIPGVALAVDVAATVADSVVTFSGGADLPVVPAATGLAVVGVAARKRDWRLALGGFVVVMAVTSFASRLGGTSLGPLGTLLPGIPLFVLGYVAGGGHTPVDRSETAVRREEAA
ncbi:hypothetical protein [Haloferax profundi]|uniref:Uncharacterized protein n=1 Tax=Haloferax profundi TaxID=1544718 RepID=A0A0W1SX27_9EURY|nr:hypothetical protein [Haloferax profundi]KTG30827.1 hypothetical protein AUR66_06050 [Haloferax profundi]